MTNPRRSSIWIAICHIPVAWRCTWQECFVERPNGRLSICHISGKSSLEVGESLGYYFASDLESKSHSRRLGCHLCRVIDAKVFVETFSSDRMHMYNAETRQWNATPPTYACILPTKKGNLSAYMCIDEMEVKSRKTQERNEKSAFGTIYSLTELRKRFRIDIPGRK